MNKQFTALALASVMTLGLFPGTSSAATVAELQAQLVLLQQQIIALQGGSTTTVASPYHHIQTLRIGSRGEQVRQLQMCMNQLGYSTGSIDGIYGRNTAAGVMAFQTSKGLVADGIIGAKTGPVFEVACVTQVIIPPIISPTPEPGNPGLTVSNREANFRKFDLRSGDKDTINEGDKKAIIAEMKFQNDASDVRLDRLDIITAYAGNDSSDEDDAYKVFKKFYVLVDGKTVGSVSADNRKDWQSQSVGGDYRNQNYSTKENRLRISGINEIFKKNQQHTIEIAVDVANSVKLGSDGQSDWVFAIDRQSLRFTDEANLTHYLTEDGGSAGDFVSFSIEQEGANDELRIRSAKDNQTSTLLKVNDNKKSSWHNILGIEVDVDKNSADIEAHTIAFAITTDGADVADVMSDLRIKVGKETYTRWSYVNATVGGVDYDKNSTEALIEFDVKRDDLVFDNNKKTEVELQAEFKSANGSNYSQGTKVTASVPSSVLDMWDVEGDDDLKPGQLKGMATGKEYVLSLSDINFSNARWEKSQSNTNGVIDLYFTVAVEEGNADILAQDIIDTVLGTSFTDTNALIQTDDFGVFSRVSGDTVTSIPGGFRVEEGDTTQFRIRFHATGTGVYEVTIDSIMGLELPNNTQLSPTIII